MGRVGRSRGRRRGESRRGDARATRRRPARPALRLASSSPGGPWPVRIARSMSAASPVGELSPSKKSACPSTNQRPLPWGSAWKTPSRSVQSPPRTRGRSRASNTSRTREAIAFDPGAPRAAPTTPVSGSRRVSRMRASASPASRAPRRSTSPAARSAAGACSSPRPAPEQSIGASTTAKRAIPPFLRDHQPNPSARTLRPRVVPDPAQQRSAPCPITLTTARVPRSTATSP